MSAAIIAAIIAAISALASIWPKTSLRAGADVTYGGEE